MRSCEGWCAMKGKSVLGGDGGELSFFLVEMLQVGCFCVR